MGTHEGPSHHPSSRLLETEYTNFIGNCSKLLCITVGEDFGAAVTASGNRANFPTNNWFEYDPGSGTSVDRTTGYSSSAAIPTRKAATYVRNGATTISERGGYAIYSDDDASLTFMTPAAVFAGRYPKAMTQVYDGFDRNDYSGNAGSVPWAGRRTTIKSVEVLAEAAPIQPISMAAWFYYFNNAALTSIDTLPNIDTSMVRSLRGTFWGCTNLASVNLRGMDTHKVTDLRATFRDCSKLPWEGIKGFADLDFSSLVYAGDSGTDELGTFYQAGLSGDVRLDGWNTPRLVGARGMFYRAGMTTVSLDDWYAPRLVDMRGLITQYIRSTRTVTKISMRNLNAGSLTTVIYLFDGDTKLESLDLSGWKVASLTSIGNLYVLRDCPALRTVNLSNWDAPALTNVSGLFDACSALYDVDMSGWNAPQVASFASLFSGRSNLRSVSLNGSKTSGLTSVYGMFENCSRLVGADLRGWDTSSVENMQRTFYFCSSLSWDGVAGFAELDFSSLRWTGRPGDVNYGTFIGCSLGEVKLDGWNTPKLECARTMFWKSRITKLSMDSWSAPLLTDARYMFCENDGTRTMREASLRNWQAPILKDASNLFWNI